MPRASVCSWIDRVARRGAALKKTSIESLITAGECSTMELPVLVSTGSAKSRERR